MLNILYLNRNFFIYDNKIYNEFKKMGYNIFQYSLVPKLTSIDKLLLHTKLKDDILKRRAIQQQRGYIEELRQQKICIDIVLVVAGQTLQKETLHELKKMYPRAKFIWYIWDGIINLPEYAELHDIFDCIYTFDKEDANKEKLQFLPLFYIEERNNNKEIDIAFVGTDHSNRKDIISEILKKHKFNNTYIHVLTNKVLYLKDLLTFRRRNLIKYMKLRTLPYSEVINIMSKSFCVLDIPQNSQTGLTMRTIESLGVRAKLITTNRRVCEYDFYNPRNIFILDENKMEIPDESFFTSKYEELPQDIFEKYSIETWCKTLSKEFEKD